MWNKKKNYIIEYQTQDATLSIPLKTLKPFQIFFISYTDLEMQGLKSAQLLCNLKGKGKFILWSIGENSDSDNCLKIEEKFLQDSSYSLYLTTHTLYVVKMNTAIDSQIEICVGL